MFHTLLDRQAITAGMIKPLTVRKKRFDKLLFFIDQGAGATPWTVAIDGPLLRIKAQYQHYGQPFNPFDVKFSDLLLYNNFYAGYSGDDTKKYFQALIQCGTYDITGEDELVFSFEQGGTTAFNSSPVLSVYAIDSNATIDQVIKKFESRTISEQQTFTRALEIFSTTAAANRSIKINSGQGDSEVNDTMAHHLSMAVGQFEAEAIFTSLFADEYMRGRDVVVRVPASMDLFISSVL